LSFATEASFLGVFFPVLLAEAEVNDFFGFHFGVSLITETFFPGSPTGTGFLGINFIFGRCGFFEEEGAGAAADVEGLLSDSLGAGFFGKLAGVLTFSESVARFFESFLTDFTDPVTLSLLFDVAEAGCAIGVEVSNEVAFLIRLAGGGMTSGLIFVIKVGFGSSTTSGG